MTLPIKSFSFSTVEEKLNYQIDVYKRLQDRKNYNYNKSKSSKSSKNDDTAENHALEVIPSERSELWTSKLDNAMIECEDQSIDEI